MGLGAIALAMATFALVVVAAKAHGRQIRLEREAHGHLQVDFRRDNGPFTEALWRRDRIGFWWLFSALAVGTLALNVRQLATVAGWGWFAWGLAISFAACFAALGLWSLARFMGDPAGDAVWRRRAIRGSFGWWALLVLLATVTGAAALLI